MGQALHIVDRRTGGLEKTVNTHNVMKKVDRRTGGLEKIVVYAPHQSCVDRRTGGLESASYTRERV